MNNAALKRHGSGECYESGTSNAIIAKFPRRCRPPHTLSEIVRRYQARRFLRVGALVPLPEDLIE